MIGYLYIIDPQNECQFCLISCLTELKLDPKENNMIERKSTFSFLSPATYHNSFNECFISKCIVGKLLTPEFKRLSQKRLVLDSFSRLLSQMSDNI